jgi:hypothetical protein
MKTELKQLTEKRIIQKRTTKDRWSGYTEIRSKHIAYCLLRGTPYEMIEMKHRDPNDGTHEYCKRKADEIVEKFNKGELYAEDIRPSGQELIQVPASSSERSCPDTICQRLARACGLG